jgi:LacI family transcriptional regulator
MRMIQTHLTSGVGPKRLAHELDVSRSTLDARFRKVIGRSIHAEFQRQRIERATLLLQTTQLPLREVARQSGFASENYLCHVFKRMRGMTPLQIRKGVTSC